MHIPSRQVHLGRVTPSVPIPSSKGKMTTSVPIGESGSLRGVGSPDILKSAGLIGEGQGLKGKSVVQNVAGWWRLKSLGCGSPVAPGV